MRRVELHASTLFVAQRFETPHPVVELRELHDGGVCWRVKAEMLSIQSKPGAIPDATKLRDRSRCRCHQCHKHKSRRGGKNTNHKFICAECSR